MITVGLRFQRKDAALLRLLAERVRLLELGERDTQGKPVAGIVSPMVFESAAVAAERGEPLVVQAENLDEVLAMANGYSLQGVSLPVIEQLHRAAQRTS